MSIVNYKREYSTSFQQCEEKDKRKERQDKYMNKKKETYPSDVSVQLVE